MKVVILCGGLGSRLSEETKKIPKPMVKVGNIPILIHIMNIYSKYGFNDFILALGYKKDVIKKYFKINNFKKWKVKLVDTGYKTLTGKRLLKVKKYLNKDQDFLLTYGDGLSDVDISKTIEFHKNHGKCVTMTAVQPAGRYGALDINSDNSILSFKEKPRGDGSWINGGFFVCKPEVLNYIASDSTIFEQEPLINLASEGQLMSYKHSGFWESMDSLRDKKHLCKLWDSGAAPWKAW